MSTSAVYGFRFLYEHERKIRIVPHNREFSLFDKLLASQLKPVLVSFYEDEELVDAKEQLLKAVQHAITDVGGDSEMPPLPRRQGEHKRKQTADDLMKLFTIINVKNYSLYTC